MKTALFGKRTVSSITAPLSAMVSELSSYAEDQEQKALHARIEASRQEGIAIGHQVEHKNALAIADRISALIA